MPDGIAKFMITVIRLYTNECTHANECLAKGKTCNNCHELNHDARGCKSRLSAAKTQDESNSPPKFNKQRPQAKQVGKQDSSSEEYVYTINKNTPCPKITPNTITTSPKQETVNDAHHVSRKGKF